jgi:DNA-binding MarR family transcriptional regulator
MTQLVARMEVSGFVERAVPEGDRRSVLLRPTPLGRQVFEQRRVRRVAFLASLLNSLATDEQESILDAVPALERLAQAAAQRGPKDLGTEKTAENSTSRHGLPPSF